MKQKKRIIFLFILILNLGVATVTACGFMGFGDTAKWKEEVLLHDGRKIVVERWQKHGGRHELGQKPDIKEHSITFTLPGTKQVVKWKDEYSEEIGRSNFKLVALHILNATPYIITTPRLCISYNKWGRPNPPYVIFKYERNAWKRVWLPNLPLEFKNINLIVATSGDEEELVNLGIASTEKVKELNSSLTQAEYKTIVRDPINPKLLEQGCPKMMRKKEGWYSPGGAKAPSQNSPKRKGMEKQ